MKPPRTQSPVVEGLVVHRQPGAFSIERPLPVTERRIEEHPVDTFLQKYQSENSRQAMTQALKTTAKLLMQLDTVDIYKAPWETLRAEHLTALRAKLTAQKYRLSTIKLYLTALRGVAHAYWKKKLISLEDYADIKDVEGLKGSDPKRGRALAEPELAALYRACDETPLGRRNAALLAIAQGTGLRRAELAALKLEDWQPDKDDTIQLNVIGKGHKQRYVYLKGSLKGVVESWLKIRGNVPGALLYPFTAHGTPQPQKQLTPEGVSNLIEKLIERAGIKHATTHDFRRSFATELWRQGKDGAVIAKLMGHSSIQTTMGYDMRDEQAKRDAIDGFKLPAL